MSVSWPTRTLGDLYQIGSSKRVLKSDWKTHGVPFYRGREVTRLSIDGFVDNELFIAEDHFSQLEKSYGVPKNGDILITAIGTIGNTYIVREADRFYFKDASVLWMKRTGEVSSEFVSWWLKSSTFFDQLDHGNGATVDTLTINKLRGVVITIPPLVEQQRIVRLLDEAFEGIAIAKANAEKNLENAQELFESHLKSVFTQSGNGWTDKALEEVCEFSNGLWKGEKPPFERVGVIRNTNFTKNGMLDDSDIAFLDVEVKKLEKRRLKYGDIILEKSGGGPKQAVGRVALFEKEAGAFSFSNFTAALRILDSEIVDFRFLHKFLYWTYLSGATEGMQSNSTGIRNLDGDAYKSIRFRFPPLAEQRKIASLLDELQVVTDQLARICSAKQASLEDLKESLLHQAFAGQLKAA
jgi:type I restriction enzyme S subunit